ncbi:ATP synthase F0 subunit C [Candidatus Cardinium hertigii]|uniref:ATP synthase subunit c n=1 Tax=Candidatus Cardinium hertigii TaxID=247481 RepID=A0A2Z3LCL1_9BACT|nr:ATP synthase F0 subunit C [Candidatus Cardinium hertigii]AWN81656.1 ATP synthase subunit c [Candidatus Cardinium hertigii]
MLDISSSYAYAGAGIGVGIVVLGAAIGIGKIGHAAMEAISRQPEISGQVRAAMIIACSLIEGAALFAILVCLLIVLK